jgi:hypothetical protein
LDRRESVLHSTRAFISGADRQHYLRRQGARLTLERETGSLRLVAGVRDERELAAATTATWNLSKQKPVVFDNLAAAAGRVREMQLAATARVPGTPAWVEGAARIAADGIGSDFDYRRWRLAAAAEIPVASVATFVPQAMWGRLEGDTVPQAAFYFGGTGSLRSVRSSSVGGTGKALFRADLVPAKDIWAMLGVDRPDVLSFHVGAFGAIGAIWGPDPLGGSGSAAGTWPEREAWLSEAGIEVLHRPGIPDPAGWIRFEVAWPIGPGGRSPRIAASFTRVIDVLRVIGD